MKALLIRLTPVPLLAGLLLALPAPAQVPEVPPFRRDEAPAAPPPVPAGEEPEVQARGPVHEGYAMPAEGFSKAGPVAPKAPPEPIAETPPDEKPEGDAVIWMPGYWMWDEDRADFLWVSGFWRVAPPGRKWVPGYWAKADAGFRWVSGLWAPAGGEELRYNDAPPVPLDVGPSQPAPDEFSTYVPGIWVQRDRWMWRPGFWLAPREDWIYCPPRWCWTPRGHLFCGGFWDRPLGHRGVLFAPVYFGGFRPRLWSPRFVVGVNPLLGSLWVRPGFGYAFGDFYGAGYGRRGYTAWAAAGPRFRDPLFSHYRFQNRADPNWANGLRTNYDARVRNESARPARTLALQDRSKGGALVERIDRARLDGVRLTKVTPAERT
ncbi:MAG: hypothetical protein ACRC33_28120, partial [Gemmataceae bacterium]